MLGVGISPPLLMNQQSIPRRVRSILNKYGATMLLPGVAEPILGPELVGSAWVDASAAPATATFSAGVLTLNATGGTSRGRTSITTVANRTYRVTARKLNAGSDCTLDIGTSAGGSQLSVNNTVGTSGVSITFVATTTQTWLNFYRGATSVTDVTDISVREILGYNHTRYSYQAGNYRESTGQTLAAADQQVGLVVDAARVPGPELVPVLDFTTWAATAAVTGRTANSFTTNAIGGVVYSIPSGSGKTYEVTISGTTTATLVVRNSSNSNGQYVISAGTFSTTIKSPAMHETNGQLYLALQTAGTLSDVMLSIRELPGIHASQSTSGFQPVLRRGLVNLLTYSADFGNAVWTVVGDTTKSGNAITYPTGGSLNPVRRNYTFKAGETYTVAMDASVISGVATGSFDLQNIDSKSFTLGSGLVVATFTPADDRTWLDIQMTGTSVVSVGAIAVFQGTVTAEEIIAAGGIPVTTTAPASSANGSNSWQFDGTDDRLSLSAVPFQITEDHFIVFGTEANADATLRRLWEVQNLTGGNFGVWTTGNTCVYFASGAPAVSVVATGGVVVTAKRLGNLRSIRSNAGEWNSNNTPVISFVSDRANIGNNHAGDRPASGRFHGVIFGKGAISDSELLTLERFMAQLQGRQL